MRIANAFFRERDDFLSEDFDGEVGSIRKPEGCARHLECAAHDAPSLGVEVGAIQIWGDGHNTLPKQAGARLVSQPPAPAAGPLPVMTGILLHISDFEQEKPPQLAKLT
jgi:hypothetical protein